MFILFTMSGLCYTITIKISCSFGGGIALFFPMRPCAWLICSWWEGRETVVKSLDTLAKKATSSWKLFNESTVLPSPKSKMNKQGDVILCWVAEGKKNWYGTGTVVTKTISFIVLYNFNILWSIFLNFKNPFVFTALLGANSKNRKLGLCCSNYLQVYVNFH